MPIMIFFFFLIEMHQERIFTFINKKTERKAQERNTERIKDR
jgi:hypothetical protein